MPATPSPGGIVGLIQGIQRPLYPDTMGTLPAPMQKYLRDLDDYLRRLGAIFTPANIINTISLAAAVVVDIQYDSTTHKFQVKKLNPDGTVSGWVNWSGAQPVKIDNVVESLDTVSSELNETSVADVYVLEKGSESTADTGCACGGGGGGGEDDSAVCGPFTDGDGTTGTLLPGTPAAVTVTSTGNAIPALNGTFLCPYTFDGFFTYLLDSGGGNTITISVSCGSSPIDGDKWDIDGHRTVASTPAGGFIVHNAGLGRSPSDPRGASGLDSSTGTTAVVS